MITLYNYSLRISGTQPEYWILIIFFCDYEFPFFLCTNRGVSSQTQK